ncbi:MAG: DUF4956 domain-containing protein [Clostridiales bacterium]|jgi:uncharacterized membrane protein YhiD involved in acid resistance|nr:DUF4956 domain-containing protein [Clostridiales bacterium]
MQDLIALFTQTESIDVVELGIDLILSALMSGFTYLTFVRFGNTVSSRQQFGKIFFLVAVCTCLIIAVIKSSIALSLGLVGALSIVRFRAAVKEPEELAYLFLCVATGLGFGAGLRVVTLFAVVLILVIIALKGVVFSKKRVESFNFSVMSQTTNLNAESVSKLLRPYSNELALRRADDGNGKLNLMFAVEFKSMGKLQTAINELKAKDNGVSVSFMSNDTLL